MMGPLLVCREADKIGLLGRLFTCSRLVRTRSFRTSSKALEIKILLQLLLKAP